MLQKRHEPIESCQLKFTGAGLAAGQFEGYASTFGSEDSFGDTILRGAFARTLKERRDPVKMFFNHAAWKTPIGIWLDLKEDDTGLRVKGETTPGNSEAQNVYASLKHGAIDALSIGFFHVEGGFEEKEAGGKIISDLDLLEISPVAFPAEPTARISAVKHFKNEVSNLESLSDCETFLRDAGMFTRAMATAFVSQVKRIGLSDSAAEYADQIKALEARLANQNGAAELRYFLSSLRGET